MAFNTKKYCSNELDSDRPLRLEHRFLVLRKLGQGTYGKVQLALNKETNEEVAVKTIKKAKIENEEDMLRIRREIHIMSSLQHPHIIHIHEVFETKQKIVIVMQYASGGELYDYLGCHQTLPEDEARRIFRQIASAVYYCHKNQICHRDLKLENILLDEEGNAKIADFGLSNIFDDKRRMNTFCGSPLYASPEIVKGTPYKGPEVDCWSLGVLLYTLVYGTMPFDGRSFKELVSQISEGRYEEPIYRSNASSLIRWLLTPDIAQRATIEDVCKDSWVNEGYDTPLVEMAESMALSAELHKQKINSTKVCPDKSSKNDREKSIFKKAAAQLEETAGKFTTLLTKNFENMIKTNETISQKRKPNFYDQIINYDVRFVLNKIIAAVEASLKADKLSNNLSSSRSNMTTVCNVNHEESSAEKIDSAYIIPIFEVTSTIPKERNKNFGYASKNSENNGIISKIMSRPGSIKSLKENGNKQAQVQKKFSESYKTTHDISQNGEKVTNTFENGCKDQMPSNIPSSVETLLKNSPKPFYSLNISGQPHSSKKDFEAKSQYDNSPSRHPSQKNKVGNDNLLYGPKQPNPFMRTKHHVLTLARILSLNYEKIMRNSFRVPPCKKKLPGKITIPPTFDPSNPPTTTKKAQDEKKELLIFPTVSVSENKEKIEKKIDKIKKAALNKNLIIRSDSKTRMRIEKYIRSQVKRIQDLVREEQRSLQASLEHLDEQSLRDMSEMYYCTYGSENTDSGIANAEDEDYFCFLCSKPNTEKGTSGVLDSFILDSIKKGCLYTSNHLHIPRAKEHDKWGYSLNSINLEFGSLSRCKSEIQFPHQYLNYISPNNKSDLSKKTSPKQVIQRNDIGNTKCFLTVPSTTTPNSSELRILRSASDSVGLHLSKNTFDVVKLNTECHSNVAENYNLLPDFLQQAQSGGFRYFGETDYETQSTSTDTTFMNKSQILDKDDGIGDSNDSFQSYIETLENFENDSVITRSMSSHSYTKFTKDNSSTNQLSSRKFLNKSNFRKEYESECGDIEKGNTSRRTDILNSESWIGTLEDGGVFSQQFEKGKGLRRRNTMSCLRRKSEAEENLNFGSSCTEFENYLWNAYKEHLLQSSRNDTEYSSSPNLNYYSLDRKAKFKNRDSKSMDYVNGDINNDFMSNEFSHVRYPDEESSEIRSTFKKTFKHPTITRNRSDGPVSQLNRTKSLCTEALTDSDRDDIIQRIRQERRLSHCNSKLESKALLTSSYLDDFEKTDQRRKKNAGTNRRRLSTTSLSKSKQNKSEYKKSFLQLLALKRIEEAEKELDKSPRSQLLNNEEDNSGSLLEALKTHGYKNVISQRFKDTDDDFLDNFHLKYLKSPRKLRAELARLNYMYYESLPRYTLGPFEENSYLYDDLDYTRSLITGLPTTSFYDMSYDFRPQPKQPVHDWLDTTQFEEYINYLKSDTFYNSEESTPTPETRRCCTHWGKENYRSFDDESTSESQDTIEDSASNSTYSGCPKNKEINVSNDINPTNNDRFQTNSSYSDDERQESVHDRIWRKSFYSRFNNRALSRKERLSFIEPELSESRLGFLNNRYSSPLKSGYDKSELLQRDGSNKSFHTKRLQKHSPSFDKFESRGSMKKKSAKTVSEKETRLENEESCSNKTLKKVSNTYENEEPEH